MKNLFKSLATFQQEVPVIHKGTQGYGYSYADLPAIFEVINPLLKKNGLGFTQLIQGASIETVIFHIETGEQLKSLCEIPQNVELKGMNQFQILGSAITYLRRYALSSALGLVTDKDTDAAGEQVKKEVKKEDDRPWLTDQQFNSAKARIENGEIELLTKLELMYKMKKEFKEALKLAAKVLTTNN
jgi:hypothetical protein